MSVVIFDSEIAKIVGINAAIIFERIRYFCEDAKLKNDHYKFHNGRFWTYSSSKGWSNMLPFLTKRQAEKAINALIAHKMIITDNFNKNKYDRTRWFTVLVDTTTSISPVGEMHFTENVNSIYPKREMNLHLGVNEFPPGVEPIPNESTNKYSKIIIIDETCGDKNTENIEITKEANQQQQIAHNSYNSTKQFDDRLRKSSEYLKFKSWIKKNKELWSFMKFKDCIFENFETFEDFKTWFDEKTSESIDAISNKQQDFDPEKNPNDKKTLAKYLYKIIENELFIGKYG